MTQTRVYISIDLKSFYASVECRERGLDPLTAKLVVADESRTDKTICLAVSPALKAYGIPGRCRLFEVKQKLREVYARTGEKIEFIAAVPRMALYMKYSTQIYHIYLKYIAPEDIHVYSIDEVFMDVTAYLDTYRLTPAQLASKIITDVYEHTKITATAGIGTNLYLSKVAMDIMAKHAEPDENGVRIAELDEISYRRALWDHKPITDFWRVGAGYARKLAENGLFTMGDVARCSLGAENAFHNEQLLFDLFGVNAELLIDHAWGYEPCTIAQIKAYKPENNSIGSGQVLHCAYDFAKAKLIVREMTELLVLDLVDKGLVTDQMVLTVGYDIENLTDPAISRQYRGEIVTDRYGRRVPKHAHGTANLGRFTSSTRLIVDAVMDLYERIVNPALLARRVYVTANHVQEERKLSDGQQDEHGAANQTDGSREGQESPQMVYEQLDLFTDYAERDRLRKEEEERLKREKSMQQAVLDIQKKYGKNAILKGMNLEEGAMTRERNAQIGGHKA
ncbi:MAG: DNA methylase [Lachnospiraceae bacterium]|nr:DNA methylase [Lachnospiraceae bacterium]